jgi:hypothetical protein
MRIVFMSLGIAKIDEQTVTEKLGDVPVIASNHLRTGSLIRTDHVPVLFGVELAGESSGVHKVTEHDGELATFGFGRVRGDWCSLALSRRDIRRGRRRNWRSGCRCAGRPTGPDEHLAVFIHRQLFGVDEVIFQVFQHVVIELQPSFEDPIGDALLLLEECNDLCQDRIVVH